MTQDMNHRLGNCMSYRSFSGNQIVMLLTLHFDFFPTVFLRKEKNTEKKKDRRKEAVG